MKASSKEFEPPLDRLLEWWEAAKGQDGAREQLDLGGVVILLRKGPEDDADEEAPDLMAWLAEQLPRLRELMGPAT